MTFGVAGWDDPQLLEKGWACVSWSFHRELMDYSNSCRTHISAPPQVSVVLRSSVLWRPACLSPGMLRR